jgi:hypothetical protein
LVASMELGEHYGDGEVKNGAAAEVNSGEGLRGEGASRERA